MPPVEKGRTLSLVAALGVDPDRLLASRAPSPGEARKVAIAMALEGVDLFHGGGLLSIAHTSDDIDFTVDAFDKSLTRLQADGKI